MSEKKNYENESFIYILLLLHNNTLNAQVTKSCKCLTRIIRLNEQESRVENKLNNFLTKQ